MKKLIIGVLAAAALAACSTESSTHATSTASVTADMVADALGTATITRMCDALDLLPYDTAEATFANSYNSQVNTQGVPGPTAEEVFAEIASRC